MAGPTGECEPRRGKKLQRRSENLDLSSKSHSPSSVREAPPIVDEVLRSPGQPLDQKTRAFMEPRFGHDFGNVRVHTDGRAAKAASMVDARAYTVGSHIVFGVGEYAPQTGSGLQLLSHELTHVVQQRAGVYLSGNVGQIGDNYERQADSVARHVGRGESAGPLLSDGAVQAARSVSPAIQFQKDVATGKNGDGLDPVSNPASGAPEIIKLAFLGFLQTSGSWADAVASKTTNVFPSRDHSGAVDVIKKHFDSSPGPFEIRIAGYSWGGWTALELARDLILSRKVLNVLSSPLPHFSISVSVLDPVSSFRRPLRMNPAEHSIKVFNIYQRNGCFGRRCGISTLTGKLFRGQPIAGANNTDVTEEGRSEPEPINDVPPTMTPDHVHLGYEGYGGHDKTVASKLDA